MNRRTAGSGLTKVDRSEERVKPAYWAYLRACVHLIEAGKPVTSVNLAKDLGISKQAAWKFLRRHPDVWTFVDAELRSANAKYFGLVQRRMAILGMQGSVAHAEAFFKSEAGVYARDLASGGPGQQAFVINNLIPRPEPLEARPAPPRTHEGRHP